jgi:hypothetical protein
MLAGLDEFVYKFAFSCLDYFYACSTKPLNVTSFFFFFFYYYYYYYETLLVHLRNTNIHGYDVFRLCRIALPYLLSCMLLFFLYHMLS